MARADIESCRAGIFMAEMESRCDICSLWICCWCRIRVLLIVFVSFGLCSSHCALAKGPIAWFSSVGYWVKNLARLSSVGSRAFSWSDLGKSKLPDSKVFTRVARGKGSLWP